MEYKMRHNDKIKKIAKILLLGICILVLGTFVDKSEEHKHELCHHKNCVACSIIAGNNLFLKNANDNGSSQDMNNLLLLIFVTVLIFVGMYDNRAHTLIDMKARMDC